MSDYGIYQHIAQKLREAVKNAEIAELQELCGPFVIDPTEEFLSSRLRVLYVGQETHGWDTSITDFLKDQDGLKRALGRYRDFSFGESRSSPFWRFHHKLAERLGFGPRTLLWSNLVRFGLKKSPGESASLIESSHPDTPKLLDIQRGTLLREIEELQVHAVVFVTGPNYDAIIRDEFGDVEFLPIRQVDEPPPGRWLLDIIQCKKFPDLQIVRTYHPKPLQLYKIFDRAIEGIARQLLRN
ncbi:MAG TPA: hypothetical protein PLA85_07010 [Micropepsaceae bacterium]|nr:hypothetical protein [Micropepsaceae bacterium]